MVVTGDRRGSLVVDACAEARVGRVGGAVSERERESRGVVRVAKSLVSQLPSRGILALFQPCHNKKWFPLHTS